MRLRSALRLDARLQWRRGFHAAYAFVAVAYALLLDAVPAGPRGLALPPVLLSETAVIGFFFAGTLLHLERVDGTLSALATTPLRPVEYVAARALSLALLAAGAALAITLAASPAGVRPALLALAAALAAGLFAAAGIAVALRFATLERFAVGGGLLSALLGLPVLPHLGWLRSPLWALHPASPSLALLAAGVGAESGLSPASVPAALGLHLAWLTAAVLLAARGLGWSGARGVRR